jgi:hypothetical protein
MKMLWFVALSLLSFLVEASTTIPGAIRWSPWYGSSNVTSVQRTLGPAIWQTRMPFFGTSNSPYQVTINGNQQSTVDAEIGYANGAGLKYWAYLWYGALTGTLDPMMNAWSLHQTSSSKNNMNWSQMMQFDNITGSSWFSTNTATIAGWFLQSNYQTVSSGRPVWFIYMDGGYNTALTNNWGGSATNFASAITTFRAAVQTAGAGNPYIIIMSGTNAAQAASLGADATTAYIPDFGTGAQPQAWSVTDAAIEAYWASLSVAAAASSIGMVPIAAEGWDTRCRKQNIVAWASPIGHNHFGQATYDTLPTASQLTSELQDAVTYVNANVATVPTTLILIYAWDECDEGGNCLMPQWTSGGPNLTTTNAVGAVTW